MNKLEQELEMRLDRIEVLMDATCLTIEELLASAAEKHTNCKTCPLLKECEEHYEYGCYTAWLLYLKEGRVE